MDILLRQTMLRIHKIASKFHRLSYFHVLQKNNSKAYQPANRAVGLEPNNFLLNEHELGWDLIP